MKVACRVCRICSPGHAEYAGRRWPATRGGSRNASDSFGGGSGMPVLPPCPASLASAHAGGDTRAPPGPGATPGISAPCMPGHCHAGPTTHMPPTGFPAFCSYIPQLWSPGFIAKGWLLIRDYNIINSRPRCCKDWGGQVGRSSCAAATQSAASPAPCI